MILPMMGLLFAIFAAGVLSAMVLCLTCSLRRFAPFALVPVLAAVGSLLFCWGLGISLERLFASSQAGGIGFFTGYVFGGLLGAGAGAWLALALTRRLGPPNHSVGLDHGMSSTDRFVGENAPVWCDEEVLGTHFRSDERGPPLVRAVRRISGSIRPCA